MKTTNPEAASQNFSPFDAVLLFSFGGPNRPEDVMPFLRNVTSGKGIPDERLAQVGEHYFLFNGKSPINQQNLELASAMKQELAARGSDLPVLLTNRNWHPYIADTVRDIAAFGAKKIAVIVTSAYASYSGDRQYREALAASIEETGIDLEYFKIRPYFNSPGFVSANLSALKDALVGLSPKTHIVFVSHSIPSTMQDASAATGPGYLQQHEDARDAVLAGLLSDTGASYDYSMAFCSRSGSPHQPWLEPDINDHLRKLAASGVTEVVLLPIGFVSDHMEVAFDLDIEAKATAEELGLTFRRAATAGCHPDFVSGLVDMLAERASRERGEAVEPAVVGNLGAFPDYAKFGSCYRIHEKPSGLPTVCGAD